MLIFFTLEIPSWCQTMVTVLISHLFNRDMARKQVGMLLCIILDELEDSKNHHESKGMLWMVAGVAMFSGWYPIIQKMLLNYMHSVLVRNVEVFLHTW